MKIQQYRFIGLTPILMDNIESVNKDLPQIKLGTKPNKGDVEAIAEGKTYKNDDGHLYMPTQALRSSLLDGCKGTKFPGLRQGPKTIFQSLIFPSEDQAVLLDMKEKPITDYEIQIDSGVNGTGKNKSRIIVVRPRVDEWQMVVPMEIDDDFAPANYEQFLSVLLEIWNRAGRVSGIGAWRPENQGKHGRYKVEQV